LKRYPLAEPETRPGEAENERVGVGIVALGDLEEAGKFLRCERLDLRVGHAL